MMLLISYSRIVLSLKNNFYIKNEIYRRRRFYSEFINFKLLKNLNKFLTYHKWGYNFAK